MLSFYKKAREKSHQPRGRKKHDHKPPHAKTRTVLERLQQELVSHINGERPISLAVCRNILAYAFDRTGIIPPTQSFGLGACALNLLNGFLSEEAPNKWAGFFHPLLTLAISKGINIAAGFPEEWILATQAGVDLAIAVAEDEAVRYFSALRP